MFYSRSNTISRDFVFFVSIFRWKFIWLGNSASDFFGVKFWLWDFLGFVGSPGNFTGRNNVFPYFVNSTETGSCL